jgi:hypothetical protein
MFGCLFGCKLNYSVATLCSRPGNSVIRQEERAGVGRDENLYQCSDRLIEGTAKSPKVVHFSASSDRDFEVVF